MRLPPVPAGSPPAFPPLSPVRAALPAASPTAFRRLAAFAALAMALVVVSGAAVRLTDSGLGCDTWPRCTETSIVAPASFHGMVEFGNRVLSTVIGVYVGI